MTRRKGISFTLTIVVAGVILLMTALSIITLGGSSISSFFTTTGEQQLETQIESACNDKARQIQQDYCEMYVPTSVVEKDENGNVEGDRCTNDVDNHPTAEESNCDEDSGRTISDSDDTYSLQSVSRSATCGDDTQNSRTIPPTNSGTDGAAYYEDGGDGHTYYERTASTEGCEWEGNAEAFAGGEIEPTVTVEGSEYDCFQRGYLSPTCPVQ